MLGPALQRLFDELDQFERKDRSGFENQLHSELAAMSRSLRRMRTISFSKGEPLSPAAVRSLTAVRADIEEFETFKLPKLDVDLGGDTGSGSRRPQRGSPISISFRCPKPDCPHKRIT